VTVLGREPEAAAIARFTAGEEPLRALVLTGGPGIGKTTLWETGADGAREQGSHVLAAQPSGVETQLSYGALIDLCEDVETEAFAALSAPQRAALEVALLRASPTGSPPPEQAIALGFLNLLRGLSADRPVVVAIDDVQWLDESSSDVLAFAARRLEDVPVRFLLARRPSRRSALEQALERRALERIEVGPLALEATRSLLADRLGLSLPRPLLRRVVESTVGNPLFALEVGRALKTGGLPELGEDIPVPGAVEEMLGTRVAALPDPLRRALLAVALSGELRVAEVREVIPADVIDDALDAGLLRAETGRVRVSHPLLAAAAKKRARRRERREIHHALAGAVSDVELRAYHLALAANVPDAILATTVGAAAAGAAARGARADAVHLAEHALRLTPKGDPERSERVLTLGGYLEAAGERQRVTDLITPELASMPNSRARVRAWLLLSDGGAIHRYSDHRDHLQRALAEAGDDQHLRAHVLAMRAINTAAEGVERIGEAEGWALEALPQVPGEHPVLERLALSALGWTRTLRGRPIDDVCQRFRDASPVAAHIIDSPDPVAGLRHAWRGELPEARSNLTRFLQLSDERGEAVSYAWLRLNMCEFEMRAAQWDAVERRLDEWAESADEELLITPTYQRCRALLAAGRGHADDAVRWAAPALADASERGYTWQVLEASRALGVAALLAGEPAQAAGHLQSVWDYTVREGIDEPGAFPVAGELVEALVELRQPDRARAVIARLRALSDEQAHPWGLATAQRCEALVRLAPAAYDSEAAASLEGAVAEYDRLGLAFDAARSLLALGRVQRRRRKWGAARGSLEAAVAGFEKVGSDGWAAQARSELERVGARRPRPAGQLTPAEQRVASLAAEGLANKEIAATLHVTVHTVELHLSRSYAKLGIRSRTQLAGRLEAAKE
jgi:DNA-binding CsgD family transcriptional regulator